MKAKVKKLWLEALRSGNYRQCREQLREPRKKPLRTRYCVLGLLCQLYIRETGEGSWGGELTLGSGFVGEELITYEVLPAEVMEWAGLQWEDPVVLWSTGNFNFAPLGTLNDGSPVIRQHSFKELADMIEKSL